MLFPSVLTLLAVLAWCAYELQGTVIDAIKDQIRLARNMTIFTSYEIADLSTTCDLATTTCALNLTFYANNQDDDSSNVVHNIYATIANSADLIKQLHDEQASITNSLSLIQPGLLGASTHEWLVLEKAAIVNMVFKALADEIDLHESKVDSIKAAVAREEQEIRRLLAEQVGVANEVRSIMSAVEDRVGHAMMGL